MIKANQLRLGNKFKGMDMIQTVFEILDNTNRGLIVQKNYEQLITCIENKNQYKPCEIMPIPISIDWLLKFGFVRGFYNVDSDYSEHFLSKNGFTIKFTTESNSFSECYLESIGIDIEYVHQLQNLYFSLIGEELQVVELSQK